MSFPEVVRFISIAAWRTTVGGPCEPVSMDPDTATRISLIGTAERLREADRDEAVTELQRIAGKNTGLLSDAAGYFAGAQLWNSKECYDLLVAAGARDQERIDAAAEQVRANRGKFGRGQKAEDQWT